MRRCASSKSPTRSSRSSAAAMISGPIPSPGRVTIRRAMAAQRSGRLLPGYGAHEVGLERLGAVQEVDPGERAVGVHVRQLAGQVAYSVPPRVGEDVERAE